MAQKGENAPLHWKSADVAKRGSVVERHRLCSECYVHCDDRDFLSAFELTGSVIGQTFSSVHVGVK